MPASDLLGASSLLFCSREDALGRGVVVRKTRYEIHTFMGFGAPASSTGAVPAVGAGAAAPEGPARAIWGRMAAEVPEKTVGIIVYTVGADAESGGSVFVLAIFEMPALTSMIVPKVVEAAARMKAE